jgi:hypothetical protein
MLAVVGMVGLAVLDWHGLSLPQPHPDAVPQLMHAFREATVLLPARGAVGYIGPTEPGVSDGEIRFIAQYALAPRLLTDDMQEVRLAIAPPGLSRPRYDQIEASGWISIASLPGGVRVYRR